MDLRRHGRGGAALEVPDHVPRASRLQPLELRPCPLLPPARPGEGGSARVLVGADVGVDGARARDHRRRRLRDPAAAPPAAHRGRLLGRIRSGTRGAGGERSRDDGALAPRPDLRVGVLAHAGLLARGARVPVLHDHRPQNDSRHRPRAPCVRHRHRTAGRAADRAADDGVRDEGGGPRRADHRLRRAAAGVAGALAGALPRRPFRAGRRARSRSPEGRARGGGRHRCRGVRGPRPARGHSRPAECRGDDAVAEHGRRSARGHRPAVGGDRFTARRGERRGGSRATSSRICASRPRRSSSATSTGRRQVRRASGSPRSGSAFVPPAAASSSRTTTSTS